MFSQIADSPDYLTLIIKLILNIRAGSDHGDHKEESSS